jgi:uncharacterized protein (TIGR02466 family)
MMQEKQILFFEPLYKIKLHLDPKEIEKTISDEMTKDPEGQVISNVCGWQSKYLVEKNDLTRIVTEIVDSVYRDLHIQQEANLRGYWYNVNKPGDYNYPHVHLYSKMSAVLFVKTPENCGNIAFMYDDAVAHTMLTKEVKEMELFIFNSKLNHMVEPNKSTENRISIAFDFD